jgi:hypothetical protein
MPIAAGVVSDLRMRAGRALQHMTTEGCAATAFDRRHDLELAETEVTGLRVTPRWPVGAENIRDLQGRARHGLSPVIVPSTIPVG